MISEFTRGSKVVVLRGERRGWVGVINEIKKVGGGLYDLGLMFNGDMSMQYMHPSEDCKPMDDNGFCMQDYLTKEEMHNVLLRIFTEKATAFVDEIINNRKEAGMGSITDQVLATVGQKYIDEHFESMTPYVLERFKNVIQSDDPIVKDEDSKSFAASIQWNLERAAGKYIDKNTEVIWSLMTDTIHELAKKMSEEQFISIISNKIGRNFKKELEATINKDLNE